jgi:FkbM family methyltransferase
MIVNFLKQHVRQYRLRRAGVEIRPLNQPVTKSGWAVWPDRVRQDSVIYSFGVGDRIGWDLVMIQQFGVTVHAFDPTPASMAWVASQKLPPQFVFHDVGISNFDGVLDLYPPRRPGGTHFSQERRGWLFDRRPSVPGRVRRLATIMQELGHDRIDVLKLDVEGAEFEVVPDLIASGVEVDQLLVEIHYQFRSRSFRMGLDLIQQLNDYGMQCSHVSQRGFEFSFVRRELVQDAPLAMPKALAA